MLSSSCDLSTKGTEFFSIYGKAIGCKGPMSCCCFLLHFYKMKRKHLLHQGSLAGKMKKQTIQIQREKSGNGAACSFQDVFIMNSNSNIQKLVDVQCVYFSIKMVFSKTPANIFAYVT